MDRSDGVHLCSNEITIVRIVISDFYTLMYPVCDIYEYFAAVTGVLNV